MMNQEDVFKKIGSILNELQDQYEFLAQNPGQQNELELELFLAHANFLTDHVQILQKLNNSKALKAISEHSEVLKQEEEEKVVELVVPIEVPKPVLNEQAEEPGPVKPEETFIPVLEKEIFKLDNEPASFEFILNDHPTDKFEFEEKSVNDIFDRPLSEEEQRIIAEKQKLHAYREQDLFDDEPEEEELVEEPAMAEQEEDEIGPEPFLVSTEKETLREEPVKVEPVILAEILPIEFIEKVETPLEIADLTPPILVKEQAKLTLNERLANTLAANNPTYGETNAKPSIADLKQGITLNSKLLYIKDLFNGYNLAYAEAIDLINKMPDFKTADAFLQKNYAVKNNWAEKRTTVDQFYEVLQQRFK